MSRFTLRTVALLIVLCTSLAAAPIALGPARVLDDDIAEEWTTMTDLDGDGILDIVRTEGRRGITCLVNRGDATFRTLPEVLGDYESLRPAVPGDLDGDGDTDLVVGLVHYVGDTYQIDETPLVFLRNDGTGILSAITVAEDCDARTQWSVVDLDADGDLDIAYGRLPVGGTQEMGLLVNDGAGSFTTGPAISPSLADGDTIDGMAAFGDLGTDGLPELFVQLAVSGPALLENEGALAFSTPVAVGSGTGEVVFADVTGDGRTDIVAGRRGRIGVWSGDGENGLASYTEYGEKSLDTRWRGYAAICLDDFDGDGDLDVAVRSWPGNVGIFANPGDGRFETCHEYHLGPGQLQAPHLRSCAFGTVDTSRGDELFAHAVGYPSTSLFLFSAGDVPPPTIRSIQPTNLEGGRTYEVTVQGTGLTAETTLQFLSMWEAEWVRVVDQRVESSERLTATIEVDHWDLDEPQEGTESRTSHVLLVGPDGGSSRLPDALAVPPYWTGSLSPITQGRLKDAEKPGRDQFKARGKVDSQQLGALFAQVGREGRLVVGSEEATWEQVIPLDDPGWKIVTKSGEIRRASWKSPRGTKPKVKLQIRNTSPKWDWSISVKKLDFPGPQEREIRVELHLGDERMASIERWSEVGPGRWRK